MQPCQQAGAGVTPPPAPERIHLTTRPGKVTNKLLTGFIPSAAAPTTSATSVGQAATINPGRTTINPGRPANRVPAPLMDDGEGKSLSTDNSDMDIGTEDDDDNSEDCSPELVTTTVAPNQDDATQEFPLLRAPATQQGNPVVGATTDREWRVNKRRCAGQLLQQPLSSQWTGHQGIFFIPHEHWGNDSAPGTQQGMEPRRLALQHPAGPLLDEWATYGCPTHTGNNWTLREMQAAIDRGPHKSAWLPEAIAHFAAETEEKVRQGQARVILWDNIKDAPPPQLKISPVAAIPHKSGAFRSILDLSFSLRLSTGERVPAVNDTTTRLAPEGAIDQIGHSLKWVIHAFAEFDTDEKFFMAKWDIQDGFWRLRCQEGEEYNFAYVLPQEDGKPVRLVIPTSLQMGWVESPPYFCTASETSRDVATNYIEAPVGSLPSHKFERLSAPQESGMDTTHATRQQSFKYLLEVYVDDFIALVIPTNWKQIHHVANGVMYGIHDVFPEDASEREDPISYKKLVKGDGQFSTRKCILGFDFDGEEKTLWLEEEKRALLLGTLHKWIRGATRASMGIPLLEFESVTAKLRHAFTALPEGRGLLSPCNWVLRGRPATIYLHRNVALLEAIRDILILLTNSVACPTTCRSLVSGWPDFVGIVDASSYSVGGIIIGEKASCPPTVFRVQWPADVTSEVVSFTNPTGRLTNSDLEMAGLLLLWLCIEGVCGPVRQRHVALFSNNSPTVSWVQRMATRQSRVAAS